MRDAQKNVKAKYDARNSYEAIKERQYLAPYDPLDKLITELEIALKEFEISDGPTELPTFGTKIVGDIYDEEWLILSERDALIWQFEREYQQAKQKKQEVVEEIKSSAASLKKVIEFSKNELKKLTPIRAVFSILINSVIYIAISVMIFSLVAPSSPEYPLAVLFTGGLFVLAAGTTLIRRHNRTQTLKSQIAEGQNKLLGLKNIYQGLGKTARELEATRKKFYSDLGPEP